jgi:hypothetical protein
MHLMFAKLHSRFQGKLPSNVKQVGHYLVFENVTMMDNGYYMCTATNQIGTDIKTFHLKVLGKFCSERIKTMEVVLNNKTQLIHSHILRRDIFAYTCT